MSNLQYGINSTYEVVSNSSAEVWNSSSKTKHIENKPTEESISLIPNEKPKIYKKRYFILLLYCLCTTANGFQWIQYPIIGSVVTCYYNVSVTTNNWTSVLFMVMFMPFVIPVAWLMNNKGLKITLIIAAAGNSLGSSLQCFSINPERYDMVILAQTVASIAQVFSVCAPAYVAALWFPASSVSTACAVGVLCNQLGIALGLTIPSILVPDNCGDNMQIAKGLQNLALGQAVINAIIFILIVLFYEDKPPTPPSIAEANKPLQPLATLSSMRTMLKNKNFLLLAIVSGLLASVYFAIITMLNQMVVRAFPGKVVDAGLMGAENIIAGVIGSILAGYIIDKTHKYRATAILLYFLSLFSMLAYTVLFRYAVLWLYYLLFGIIGFTMASAFPVSYQLAAEITYPESEGTSVTLLVGSTSLFGIFVTMFASWLQQQFGDLSSNLFFCICMFIGSVMAVFIKCGNKRSAQEYSVIKAMQEPA